LLDAHETTCANERCISSRARPRRRASPERSASKSASQLYIPRSRCAAFTATGWRGSKAIPLTSPSRSAHTGGIASSLAS
jgi:hypothetical protein